MRIVFVTQTLDADHPVLGHTLGLVAGLAQRCDEVVVLCATAGRFDLPSNVRVRTYGAASRLRRGASFVYAIARELSGGQRPDAVVAHMVPLFLVLAAPFAKLRRVPLVLWYTHWRSSRLLRVATSLADTVLSADAGSFPLRSPKVRGIGHAIDIHRFAPSSEPREAERGLRLLALGRFAEVKGYQTLLHGLGLVLERGIDATLELRGPELTPVESRHRAELERIVRETPALGERVTFAQPIPHDAVPGLLHGVDVLVSATQPTSSETFDKVLCEGAACGVAVVASNRAVGALLDGLPIELRFPPGDATAFADIVERLAEADAGDRADIGAELRRRVVESHSVDSWADAVVGIVTQLGRK